MAPLDMAALVLPADAGTAPAAATPAAATSTVAAPAVNWALDGTATATTAESAEPGPNAIGVFRDPAKVCEDEAPGAVPCVIGG